jgi:hypothetical protein
MDTTLHPPYCARCGRTPAESVHEARFNPRFRGNLQTCSGCNFQYAPDSPASGRIAFGATFARDFTRFPAYGEAGS